MKDFILLLVSYLLSLIMAMQFAVFIHEFGHFVTGSISGYRFKSFTFLGKTLYRDNGKFKTKKSNLPAAAGGQCLMMPPDGKDIFPYKLYNYGGVIFNLLMVIIFLIVFYFNMDNDTYIGTFLDNLSFMSIIINIFLAISNGFPFVLSGVPVDGKNIKEAGKSENSKKAFCKYFIIEKNFAEGMNILDFDYKFFKLDIKEEELDNYFIAYIEYLRIIYLILKGDGSNLKNEVAELSSHSKNLPLYYKAAIRGELMSYIVLVDELNEFMVDLNFDEDLEYLEKMKVDLVYKIKAVKSFFIDENIERSKEYLNKYEKNIKEKLSIGELETEIMWLEKFNKKLQPENINI